MAVSSSDAKTKGLPFPEMQGPSDPGDKIQLDKNGIDVLYVPTKMNYVTRDTIEINVRRDVAGCDSIYEGATWDKVDVQVQNARHRCSSMNPANLNDNGFELLDSPVDKDIDYLDTDEVIDQYYPSCENLLKQVLGSKVVTVKAFDHNIRISSSNFGPELKGGGGSAKAQVPLGMVHGDYTKVSGPKRLNDLGMPPKANDVLKTRLGDTPLLDPKMVEDANTGKRRFALINVWRSIDKTNPVEEFPLACIDSKTVNKEDLKTLKIHYKDRIGQNFFLSHSKNHKWYFYSKMMHHEALLIKQWDSFGNFALFDLNTQGCSTFAAHSAFMDPTSPQENCAPRQSIEVRCAVLWEIEENEE